MRWEYFQNAPDFCKTRVPQLIYQCDNVFAIRIHYHTAVGLSPAPSSLSKINTRSKREGCEVTRVKGTRGVQTRQDAQTVSGPWRKYLTISYILLSLSLW